MDIVSVKIKNFRGYKNELTIPFDNLTVLVGKNDIGKSTILEALDIFFNDGNGVAKIDRTDLNIFAARDGDEETVISVCFSDLPSQVVIDATVQTTLAEEYMLNAHGLLEVVKRYRNGGKATVHIRALHPTNAACSELLLKKNADLKKIISDKQIDCDNQTINAKMRKAIWGYYADDLALHEIEIDVSKEDAKKIWEKLSAYLPVYSLFQSDRKNSDGDSEVQDPLKEAVKQIMNDEGLQATLAEVAQTVATKLHEVSSRTLAKLREMDPDVANSLNPVIPSADKLKWVDVFKSVSIAGDEDIPINKRGSGVKRLVLLNFFRAEAERRAEEGDNTGIIYAIEEPETSQHSNNQRMLIDSLKWLAHADHTQVILTTHSPVIVKQLEFSNIRIICDGEHGKSVTRAVPPALRYPSLNEVNYIAYGEVSEEYHNELYGFLSLQKWLQDYKVGKQLIPYTKVTDTQKKQQKLILTEYIRHQIHHPENQSNPHFTHEQLAQSIEDMRSFIFSRTETIALDDPLPDEN